MSQIWIALAHVKLCTDNDALETAKGAFVPVLGIASDLDAFVALCVDKLQALGFEAVEFEDVQPFKTRLETCEVSSEVIALADSLSVDFPFAYGTFHSYPS
ncbi:MAG: hypothetical protein KF708_19210 [Pirellulales bacterium]|nr:hypothetical protein [Pirellulales bacterium]